MPAIASNIPAPLVRPGHASGASKSAKDAGAGAKVFVSCWNPPIAMRATGSVPTLAFVGVALRSQGSADVGQA